MVKESEWSYAAKIKIALPGMAEAGYLIVTLLPPDAVETAAGHIKPLSELTLAELQEFASRLESAVQSELADELKEIKLADLAGSEPSLLEVTLLAADGAPLSPNLDWRDRPVRLPGAPEEPAPDAGLKAESDPGAVTIPSASPPLPSRPRIAGRRRPLGHSTAAASDILINETAFRAAQAHALGSLDREVAGVLVGPVPEKQPDGRYLVHITDTIIAKHTRMQGASVTYTPESWRYLNDRLAELYPDDAAVMVGWYHTHPGFGIFLSGMDQFIHQNFFTQLWHIALVLDPLARKSGFFCWNRFKGHVNAYDFPWPAWAAGSW